MTHHTKEACGAFIIKKAVNKSECGGCCMLCVDEVQRIVLFGFYASHFPPECVHACGFELQRVTQHENDCC